MMTLTDESDSDYFTADEGDALEAPRKDQADMSYVGLWKPEDFYQFQCRDGTVWLLPKYYNPELDLDAAIISCVILNDRETR